MNTHSTITKLIVMLAVITMLVSACGPAKTAEAPQPTSVATEALIQPTAVPTGALVQPTTPPVTKSNTLRITIDSWLIQKWPIDRASQRFMADHPEVKVTVAPNAEDYGNNWLLPWSQGQTESDLVCGGMDTTISPFVAKELLVPLDDMFVNDGKINLAPDQFVAPLLAATKFGGHYYAMPFMGEVYYVTVNLDMMKAAGLTDADGKPIPPKSLDEWYQYAKKLTVKDANGKVQVWGLHLNWGSNSAAITYMALLQAQQGTYLNKEGTNNEECPGSILRKTSHAHLYLDIDSAQKILPKTSSI